MSRISNCSVVPRCTSYIQNNISVKTSYNKPIDRVLETPALWSAVWLSTMQICFAMSRNPLHYCNDVNGWLVHRMFVMSACCPETDSIEIYQVTDKAKYSLTVTGP